MRQIWTDPTYNITSTCSLQNIYYHMQLTNPNRQTPRIHKEQRQTHQNRQNKQNRHSEQLKATDKSLNSTAHDTALRSREDTDYETSQLRQALCEAIEQN